MQRYSIHFTIPVSEQLVQHGRNFRTVLDDKSHYHLLESVVRQYGFRYFVAFLYDEKVDKDIRRGLVLFEQTWILTLY